MKRVEKTRQAPTHKAQTTTVDPAMKLAADWIHAICHGRPETVRVECRRQGWGPFQTGLSVVNQRLCVAGKTYADGFGAHADSEIVIRSRVRGTDII